jgi:hypothetical protein
MRLNNHLGLLTIRPKSKENEGSCEKKKKGGKGNANAAA